MKFLLKMSDPLSEHRSAGPKNKYQNILLQIKYVCHAVLAREISFRIHRRAAERHLTEIPLPFHSRFLAVFSS